MNLLDSHRPWRQRVRRTFGRASSIICALLIALAIVPVAVARESGGETALRATLDRHMQAINARDLDKLMATVTGGERLTTILPNGKVLDTREQYRQLHVDWFKDQAWRMVFTVEELRVLGDTGIARVRYDSQSRDDTGEYQSKRQAILTLVFAREAGQWRLVYDQNTVIPGSAVPPAAG